MPVCPAAIIESPILYGRKIINMIPDAKLESVPWNARLTANPTAPINTEKLAVSNPNLFSTNDPAINKIAQRVNFAKKRERVG